MFKGPPPLPWADLPQKLSNDRDLSYWEPHHEKAHRPARARHHIFVGRFPELLAARGPGGLRVAPKPRTNHSSDARAARRRDQDAPYSLDTNQRGDRAGFGEAGCLRGEASRRYLGLPGVPRLQETR